MRRLVTLLAVVAGLGIVCAGLLPIHLWRCGSATQTVSLLVTQAMKTPLEAFRQDNGRYPSTDEGLAALIRAPQQLGCWRGPYLDISHVPADPWGRELQYRFPGIKNPSGYDCWSLGPDGIPSADDIENW